MAPNEFESSVPPSTDVDSSGASGIADIKAPPFLHEREIADAFRNVNLIAAGRNPFSSEVFEKLQPEHRDSAIQSLCVLVSALSQAEPLPMFKPPPAAPVDPSSKRPLVPYLDRVEREAITEALAEVGGNRTAAARLLGITFRALRYRLERLGLDNESAPPSSTDPV